MTDTPKDRDDEAVEVFAQAIATAMGEGLHGASPGFKRVAAAVLSDARSAGYIVARPVADEEISKAIEAYGDAWYRRRNGCIKLTRAHLDALIHAREAALRAERDAALLSEDGLARQLFHVEKRVDDLLTDLAAARAALADAEKRCETMREALERCSQFGNTTAEEIADAALRRARAATEAER